jgi:hypothetical protein
MVEKIVIVSGLSAFLINFLGVSGLLEKIQTFAPRLIAKAANCGFCLSFWVCLGIYPNLPIFTEGIFTHIVVIMASTVITRKLT